MADSTQAPERPSVARMYSYWLGGNHFRDVDRMAAEKVIEAYPDVRFSSRANRAFLRRCVEYLAQQGVRQYIDLGSGLPIDGAVHEVVGQVYPDARVVYIDNDPFTVSDGQVILRGNSNVTMISRDAREPETILGSKPVKRLIDFSQPVAVLALTIFNYFVDDAVVANIINSFRAKMAPGSFLAITHGTYDAIPQEIIDVVDRVYSRTSASSMIMRTTKQIEQLFEGFEIVEPGLVYTPLWRPDNDSDPLQDRPERAVALAGVGKLR